MMPKLSKCARCADTKRVWLPGANLEADPNTFLGSDAEWESAQKRDERLLIDCPECGGL